MTKKEKIEYLKGCLDTVRILSNSYVVFKNSFQDALKNYERNRQKELEQLEKNRDDEKN